MRILILSNIDPFCIGGAEVQARLLGETFAAKGHRVTIAGWAVPNGRLSVKGRAGQGVETIHLPTIRMNRLSRALSYFSSLALFLLRHRNRSDVIYCRMVGEAALVASLLRALHVIRQPVVACSECRGDVGDAAFLRGLPLTGLLVRLLNRQCSAVNVLSPDIRNELLAIGFHPDRFVFIPNGVVLPEAGRRVQYTDGGPIRFLFVGRLVPVKGVADLLQATRTVVTAGHAVRINIVGQGPLAADLEALARSLGIEHCVRFHGSVPHTRMSDHYRANHVVVSPSHHEGQGMAVAEALGYGLPAVVTRSGGPESMVNTTAGLLCPVGDPDALARAMMQMCQLRTDQWERMSDAARRRIAQSFDIRNIADDYLKLFQKLIT